MNLATLRALSYAGTGVIALDRLREASKTRKATDYLLAGGIAAGLALQIISDREESKQKLKATMRPVQPVGTLAGIGTSVASATSSVTQSPTFWQQAGMFTLDVAKGVGTAALSAWAADEITGSGGRTQSIQLVGSQAPQQFGQNPSGGLSTGAVVAIVAGSVGLLGVLLIATRR